MCIFPFERSLELIQEAQRIGCLTGAGISTLCGIPDFRGPLGLYRNPDAERIFDINWFDRDPSIYYRGCAELVYGLDDYKPGPVHLALKRLEELGKLQGIATQNIDMLHQKAGSTCVYEIHGSPEYHHCRTCGACKTFHEIVEMLEHTDVPRCACGGVFKPDITFFGEELPEAAFKAAQELAVSCDLFLVLGTSLTVYPAAGLPRLALHEEIPLVIVNEECTPLHLYAKASHPDLLEFAEAILENF